MTMIKKRTRTSLNEKEGIIRSWAQAKVEQRDSLALGEPYIDSYAEAQLKKGMYTIDEIAELGREENPIARDNEDVRDRIEVKQNYAKKASDRVVEKGLGYFFKSKDDLGMAGVEGASDVDTSNPETNYKYTTGFLFNETYSMQEPISEIY